MALEREDPPSREYFEICLAMLETLKRQDLPYEQLPAGYLLSPCLRSIQKYPYGGKPLGPGVRPQPNKPSDQAQVARVMAKTRSWMAQNLAPADAGTQDAARSPGEPTAE